MRASFVNNHLDYLVASERRILLNGDDEALEKNVRWIYKWRSETATSNTQSKIGVRSVDFACEYLFSDSSVVNISRKYQISTGAVNQQLIKLNNYLYANPVIQKVLLYGVESLDADEKDSVYLIGDGQCRDFILRRKDILPQSLSEYNKFFETKLASVYLTLARTKSIKKAMSFVQNEFGTLAR